MAEIIEMPLLSDTMEEGVIAAWHKKVGDEVASGDLLAEIETDKATMDFESPFDGYLLYIGVEEGGAVPVGQLLAILSEDKDEDVSALVEEAKQKAESAGDEEGEQETETVATPEPQEEKGAAVEQQAEQKSRDSVTSEGRIKASPLAKSMAKEKGIDLHKVEGTGENGRIVKRDIEAFVASGGLEQKKAAKQESAPAFIPPSVSGEEGYTDVTNSQMRKTIARRLSESKFSAPHFYLTMEIDMDRAVEARKALNAVAPVKISYNDMIVKAAAVALRQHPNVNVSWMGDKIRKYDHIHIGVAVAVDEGLIVPVIRFADIKGLASISQETKDLAGKARDRKLQPADWEGNTFTISNLGMFGIEEFTAIINPPDACIMAVGAINQVPVVRDGQIVPGNVMKVTLSCDHRAVDGATGSAFLQTFKKYLEDPVRMLL